MPRFLHSGSYKPCHYSKEDHLQYEYLLARANESSASSQVGSSIGGVSSAKTSQRLEELCMYYLRKLEAAAKLSGDEVPPAEGLDFFTELRSAIKKQDINQIIFCLSNSKFDNVFNEKRGFTQIKERFLYAIRYVSAEQVRDPDEFSPVTRSLHYLDLAFRAVSESDMTPEIQQAHASNLRFVNSAQYVQCCENEFLRDGPVIQPPMLSQQAVVARSVNSGFLLRIYQDSRFRHWLTQVLLFAIVLAAALVVMACTLNATLLPLAIGSIVKGLSTMATKSILGGSCVVGVAAAVTLATSLYARFFAAPKTRDAAASFTPQHAPGNGH